jgi:hypothetical protein
MARTPHHPTGAVPPRSARRAARKERLSAALKANLRRRKLQARERAEMATGENAGEHAPPDPARNRHDARTDAHADTGPSHDSAGIVEDKRKG